MEKINNYTPGPWQHDGHGDFVSVSMDASKMICDIRGWGWLQKLGEEKAIEIQKANGELIALAPTLYEQHFKMLELLKGDLYFIKIELKERLKFSDINTDDKTKAMSDRIKELEQTIKECEL